MGTGLSQGRGRLRRRRGEGSLSGGRKDGYVSECWERRAIDGPYSIDGLRTRLVVLERGDSRARSHISMCFVCSSAVTESVTQLYH